MSDENDKTRMAQLFWLGKLISIVVLYTGMTAGAVWGVMNGLLGEERAATAACRVELSEANSGCDERVSEANQQCDERVTQESARLSNQLDACFDKLLGDDDEAHR